MPLAGASYEIYIPAWAKLAQIAIKANAVIITTIFFIPHPSWCLLSGCLVFLPMPKALRETRAGKISILLDSKGYGLAQGLNAN